MDLFWYCQGGEQLIERLSNLQFSDGQKLIMCTQLIIVHIIYYTESMHCKPKSIVKALIVSVEKTFGVYSKPVAILLAILIGVAGLYVLLIPAACVSVFFHSMTIFTLLNSGRWQFVVTAERSLVAKGMISLKMMMLLIFMMMMTRI